MSHCGDAAVETRAVPLFPRGRTVPERTSSVLINPAQLVRGGGLGRGPVACVE
ncbi:hypothetical protein IscW_ISCW014806 [Ixodes scapularis]|uniref:Uncharacterized protein n=1 Tax=Ixodes scapularis TaxID=6945 RepID=B7QLG4_IXOSC|nr:hypothetical protein IscW_ISCW014806 [Ixodes scapularis]|eukprot:XP_002416019.1 hypothetical protein IscW_ISCW014806 [Ixodes scapularis]